jgi:hypothetical protein
LQRQICDSNTVERNHLIIFNNKIRVLHQGFSYYSKNPYQKLKDDASQVSFSSNSFSRPRIDSRAILKVSLLMWEEQGYAFEN